MPPLHGQAAVDQLLEILDLEQRDDATFIGESPRTGAQRVFGGQAAAQALPNLNREVWVSDIGITERPPLVTLGKIRTRTGQHLPDGG